jgi:hypothetical protein
MGMPQPLNNTRTICWDRLLSAKFSLVPAGATWGHSGKPTEVPGKVAVVRKSRGQCDLGQRQFGIVKHALGGFDASPQ